MRDRGRIFLLILPPPHPTQVHTISRKNERNGKKELHFVEQHTEEKKNLQYTHTDTHIQTHILGSLLGISWSRAGKNGSRPVRVVPAFPFPFPAHKHQSERERVRKRQRDAREGKIIRQGNRRRKNKTATANCFGIRVMLPREY